MSDARNTVRFALMDALAEHGGTVLTVENVDPIIDSLVRAMENTSTNWAFEELVAATKEEDDG